MTNDTKRTSGIEATITDDGRLVLVFSHGEHIAIAPAELTPHITRQALLHGLKQKLVDAAAITRNPETGRSATIEDKFAAVREVYDRLLSGQWNKARGDGAGTGSLLFRALTRLYPAKSADDIRAYIAGKSDKEQAALRQNPRIRDMIDTIKAESARASDVDTDAMLDELEG